MNANVLLLGLYHPDSLTPHFMNDAEDVQVILALHRLQEPIQGDERSRPTDSGAAVDYDRFVFGRDSVAEAAHEADQRRRRIRNSEIRPGREVEVPDYSTRFTLSIQKSINQLIIKFFIEFRSKLDNLIAF